jgi:hypothetical protein
MIKRKQGTEGISTDEKMIKDKIDRIFDSDEYQEKIIRIIREFKDKKSDVK